MQISTGDTSCTAVRASGTGVSGTVHQFSPSSASQPAPQTQSGAAYSIFAGLIPGSYTINSQAPAEYVLARLCWNEAASGTSGEGLSHTLLPGDVLTWDLGYTLGVAWSQVQGGDVYASASLKSYVPVGASPRAFILDGTGGYPGVATYGADCNFDSSSATCGGKTWVSSKNWLVNDTAPATDFYQLMYRQFGGTPTSVDYVNPISAITQPAARATPYYVTGDMTTQGNWNVGAGETLIFIIDGDLTIAGKINITGSGFISFIARGNITIDSTVGGPSSTSTPVVEGIYITAPSGSFITGTGSVPGKARFVGKGMFIAGNFLLQRDVGDADNPTTSSELFIYDPQLLLTMPDAMKKMSISWQEVAP
jgi:hypothetical protein